MIRRRMWLTVVGVLPLGLAFAGCERPLDPQEYGQTMTQLPKIKGAEKKYVFPELTVREDKESPGVSPAEPPVEK
jgi:hypothetical protein